MMYRKYSISESTKPYYLFPLITDEVRKSLKVSNLEDILDTNFNIKYKFKDKVEIVISNLEEKSPTNRPFFRTYFLVKKSDLEGSL